MLRPSFKRLDKREVKEIAKNFLGEEFLDIHIMDLWEYKNTFVFIKTRTSFEFSVKYSVETSPIYQYLYNHGYRYISIDSAVNHKWEVIL